MYVCFIWHSLSICYEISMTFSKLWKLVTKNKPLCCQLKGEYNYKIVHNLKITFKYHHLWCGMYIGSILLWFAYSKRRSFYKVENPSTPFIVYSEEAIGFRLQRRFYDSWDTPSDRIKYWKNPSLSNWARWVYRCLTLFGVLYELIKSMTVTHSYQILIFNVALYRISWSIPLCPFRVL